MSSLPRERTTAASGSSRVNVSVQKRKLLPFRIKRLAVAGAIALAAGALGKAALEQRAKSLAALENQIAASRARMEQMHVEHADTWARTQRAFSQHSKPFNFSKGEIALVNQAAKMNGVHPARLLHWMASCGYGNEIGHFWSKVSRVGLKPGEAERLESLGRDLHSVRGGEGVLHGTFPLRVYGKLGYGEAPKR
ncbi:TPA: hypothetical protein HA244_01505 [Candidatus Micrarchaeota archaeon]|nr:hypothetical protein [Candidatus Micrarchaeota archaeon]